MIPAFDERVIKVGVTIGGKTTYYENLDIRASGEVLFEGVPGVCDIRISNLTVDQRNELLTKSSPLYVRGTGQQVIQSEFAEVVLEVGRKSYGTFILYQGQVYASAASQPPDIAVLLKSVNSLTPLARTEAVSFGAQEKLSVICRKIAQLFGAELVFEASDRYVANFAYTGDVFHNLQKINRIGGIKAAYDSGAKQIIVINSSGARRGDVKKINQNTGMVGVPQVSSEGVFVQTLCDRDILIGGAVEIESVINPAANGRFTVASIGFDVANRDQPFYYNLWCTNTIYNEGTV